MRKITIVILLALSFAFFACSKGYKGLVAVTFNNGDKDTLNLQWRCELYLERGDLRDIYPRPFASNVRTFKILSK